MKLITSAIKSITASDVHGTVRSVNRHIQHRLSVRQSVCFSDSVCSLGFKERGKSVSVLAHVACCVQEIDSDERSTPVSWICEQLSKERPTVSVVVPAPQLVLDPDIEKFFNEFRPISLFFFIGDTWLSKIFLIRSGQQNLIRIWADQIDGGVEGYKGFLISPDTTARELLLTVHSKLNLPGTDKDFFLCAKFFQSSSKSL